MYRLGHADPKLTMRVYQQVLEMRGGGVEALRGVLGPLDGEDHPLSQRPPDDPTQSPPFTAATSAPLRNSHRAEG